MVFAWSRGVGPRPCYRRWRSRPAQSLRGEGYWRDCRERRKTVSMVYVAEPDRETQQLADRLSTQIQIVAYLGNPC